MEVSPDEFGNFVQRGFYKDPGLTDQVIEILCDYPASGLYVRIRITEGSSNILSIAEVEIYVVWIYNRMLVKAQEYLHWRNREHLICRRYLEKYWKFYLCQFAVFRLSSFSILKHHFALLMDPFVLLDVRWRMFTLINSHHMPIHVTNLFWWPYCCNKLHLGFIMQ